MNNLKVDGWAKKLKEELEKMGLAYIWLNQTEINVTICKIIGERCNDIQRQNMFADINAKNSLTFYSQNMSGVKRVTLINAQERKE
jgi:hypothetical protein